MAVFTNYFVASAAQVAEGFPDWTMPPSQPAAAPGVHPLTGQVVTLPAWDLDAAYAEWNGDNKPVSPNWFARVVVWLGRVFSAGARRQAAHYAIYLEKRAHPLVQSSPHDCCKSLGSLDLATLSAVLESEPDEDADFMSLPEFAGPEGAAEMLQLVPVQMTAALARLDREEFDAAAAAWRATRTWSAQTDLADVKCVLVRLVKLARAAVERGHNLYLTTEW